MPFQSATCSGTMRQAGWKLASQTCSAGQRASSNSALHHQSIQEPLPANSRHAIPSRCCARLRNIFAIVL